MDLRANGVQQVTGDLVLTAFFDQPQLPEFDDDGKNDENKLFLVGPRRLAGQLLYPALRDLAMIRAGDRIDRAADRRIDNQVKVTNAKQCTGDVRYSPGDRRRTAA